MQLLFILAQRMVSGIATMIAVSVLIFLCVSMLPGDFAISVLGQSATAETVAAFQKMLGTDQPLWIRYFRWIVGVFSGDLGYSYSAMGSLTVDASRSVASMLQDRLFNTMFLASLTAVFAIPVAVTLGIVAVIFRNGVIDRLITVISISAVSIPEFLVAYILVVVLSIYFPMFHAMSYVTADMGLLDRVNRCFLPALTLFVPITGHMARMTRASVLPILSAPFIESARLKGLSNLRIILTHALPNAWGPIAAVVALNMAYLVVGAVVVEVVFVYPGVGQLMVDSVTKRDIPVVQACALIFSFSYVSFNLLADVIAVASNPRLLHPR
ncbi:ABC transporter permease [Ochrobactrum sp. C6C9]|uniref:ABC transporter permease n=1 Tax=Ochrobactrum sp. C6C9 TaxID=2736662 RepID=UPI0035303C92|nr:ABC transporter permease [Ochrobactrum sp. C6C9]